MARPARYNADYYTHTADLRNDRRVKAIRTKFGPAGYGLLHMVLEALTDADHTHLDTAPLELELLAGDFGVSATEIAALLEFGETVGYFTRNEAGLLGCPELTKWLEPVFEKRNRSKNPSPAALLSQPAAETGVSVTETTQSKGKERKGKESRQDASEPAPKPAALTSQSGGQRLRVHDDAPLFDAKDWPSLNDPQKFADLCAKLGFPQVDFGRYQSQITVSLEGLQLPSSALRNWVKSYLNNDKDEGKLLLPTVLTPNQTPSNVAVGAITGSTIPSRAEMLKTNFNPK